MVAFPKLERSFLAEGTEQREVEGPHMVEEWVWLGQHIEAIWMRALKAKPGDPDGQQAVGPAGRPFQRFGWRPRGTIAGMGPGHRRCTRSACWVSGCLRLQGCKLRRL